MDGGRRSKTYVAFRPDIVADGVRSGRWEKVQSIEGTANRGRRVVAVGVETSGSSRGDVRFGAVFCVSLVFPFCAQKLRLFFGPPFLHGEPPSPGPGQQPNYVR